MNNLAKHYLLVCLFTHLGFITYAQLNTDSLFRIWNDNTASDTTRINAIQKITWEVYLFSKPDSGFYYGQLQYDFAKSKGLKKQMADALHLQGISYAVRGNHFSALDYYQRALSIREEIGDQKGIGTSLNVIGLVYLNQGDTVKAISYFERTIHQFETFHIVKEKASSLGNIGSIYMEQGNYTKALAYFKEALKINEAFSDKRGQSQTLGQIGVVYLEQKMYTEGLDYLKRAIKSAEEISDNFWVARHMNKIGTIMEKQGKHTEAKLWCEKALHVAEKAGTLVQQKVSCKCLFEAYKGMNNLTWALEYHERMTIISDSLKKDETIKKLQQMEYSRQISIDSLKQAAEKMEVQHANEMVVRKKNKTRNILVGVGLILFILSGGLYNRWRIIKKAKAVVEYEKQRSEDLLLNILPSEIAEELKEKGRSEPRDFEMVSILFTDFKGFTQTAEKLSARELVMEINTCFEAFDLICSTYGIEKIKTIGDAYMAVGGLPVPNANSAKNTILAALEMQEFITKRKAEKEAQNETAFEMRLGIHSGPVVAGIVGVKKFQYDIWGDTVNTASRIESSGEVGKVNISGSTYALVKDSFNCIHRGKIMAKGKGEIDMYFITRPEYSG